MSNTLCKTKQYFVQDKAILCALKAAIIMCKTLCNVVQYMEKTFVQYEGSLCDENLCDYIVVQKVVQYSAEKSANTGNVGIAWQYNKNFIAQYCIHCSIS